MPIYMVFQYEEHDLAGLMHATKFSLAQIKRFVLDLLEGLNYCHQHRVVHRDIKPSNLLISADGVLKLTDFGLARHLDRPGTRRRPLTRNVVTFWYRSPELLLGSPDYDYAIDMWSAGCIMGELLRGEALFRGKTEVETLNLVCKTCGTPTPANWPGVDELPEYRLVGSLEPCRRRLREEYRALDSLALDLLDRLLTLDPRARVTAAAAIHDVGVETEPLPAKPGTMPRCRSTHELTSKQQHQQQQQYQRYPGGDRPRAPYGYGQRDRRDRDRDRDRGGYRRN